ncbi:MAG: hypothetical protein Rhims3KO_08040 [Hyphomicrobiales bacterium]
MAVFILTFCIMGLGVLGLGLGSLMGRGPVRGSCGGLSCGKRLACEGCSHRTDRETES